MLAPRQQNLVKRTFVNQERLIGKADYGTEYFFWYVKQGNQFVPVRNADGAQPREREGIDRIPPGVISRFTITVALPPGTQILLLIRRPKAVHLPKRERRTYWLSPHGRLSRHPHARHKATPAPERQERLSSAERAALARNLVQHL
jgi:hypothetical protein